MPRVLVASKISEKAVDLLRSRGFEVDVVVEPPPERLAQIIGEYDAIIVRGKPLITREVLRNARRLKLIVRAGVGLDNIDVQAAKEMGIEVANTPAATTQSVAELAVGLMLAALRKIALVDRRMREGEWPKHEAVGSELQGKVVGIVGYGRIGRAVARIVSRGFGARVIFTDSHCRPGSVDEETGATCADLDALLREADIVTLHVPLTNETRHMIDERRLRMMKRTAILINTSRGAVVDTEALVRALREGWIAGAGLDVYEEEPLPKGHPLTQLDNVVLTPHVGANTGEAQDRAGIEAAEIVSRFFSEKGG
ncbi:MAG: hydroxyacid dehydrogenase [Desulfurococcaceae archaeon]